MQTKTTTKKTSDKGLIFAKNPVSMYAERNGEYKFFADFGLAVGDHIAGKFFQAGSRVVCGAEITVADSVEGRAVYRAKLLDKIDIHEATVEYE